MVGSLIVYHHMWERPSGLVARQLASLNNATTVITLFGGVQCTYAGLWVIGLAAELLAVDTGLLHHTLGHSISGGDRLRLAWMAASMATVRGPLGVGFESDEAVRQAVYGYRHRERRAAQDMAASEEGSSG
jgi:hypothetical protein